MLPIVESREDQDSGKQKFVERTIARFSEKHGNEIKIKDLNPKLLSLQASMIRTIRMGI